MVDKSACEMIFKDFLLQTHSTTVFLYYLGLITT